MVTTLCAATACGQQSVPDTSDTSARLVIACDAAFALRSWDDDTGAPDADAARFEGFTGAPPTRRTVEEARRAGSPSVPHSASGEVTDEDSVQDDVEQGRAVQRGELHQLRPPGVGVVVGAHRQDR